MKYLLGILLVVLLLILFLVPDKHSLKRKVEKIETFETDNIRSPYISPENEMCKFGETETCLKDKAIVDSGIKREEIGSYVEERCGIISVDNLRPECDSHVTGDEIFKRVVFADFEDDKYKVLDPTEFTNKASFPLFAKGLDGDLKLIEHRAEFSKLESELDKLPFIQDNRCKFILDNVSDPNEFPFFSDNKLLNHPDGPKEPNLCYIPPNVVNVLFAKNEKGTDPDYKLCSSDNELIYNNRHNDIVEILGMDVSKTIDKDIGTPMCVVKFKDKPNNVSDSDYEDKISNYLSFLHKADPELQVRSGGYSWISDKFNVDKKIIAKQNEDEVKMVATVGDAILNADGLANQLLGYDADPNKYINDYVMHAIDDKYNTSQGMNEEGDAVRELNMSYNCAYHGTEGDDLNDKPYSKNYVDFKGVGSHISHLETPELSSYLNKWSEYSDTKNKKKQMSKYVLDNAVFGSVWDRNEGKDDKDSKENKCETTLLRREGNNGNFPDPWLGFHVIDEPLFDDTKSKFLYRNDLVGLENSAERYYRQGCEWHHLKHVDDYSESNRRSESCDWISSRNNIIEDWDDKFHCDEFGKMFVGDTLNPVDKYYTNLVKEKGEGDSDKAIVDFLLNTKNSDMRTFSKDGNRCVYRDENSDGCVTESDLPLLPSPNAETRVPIFGSGASLNDITNFVWGSNLVVKGNSQNGYTISGAPMPLFEPKLVNVLNTSEDPTTKESDITLGDNYMIIASSGKPVYVARDILDNKCFDRDPNVKLQIVNASLEYNGNTSVLTAPETKYNYILGSGKCVIANDKMIVDKNSWIDGSMNAGKVTVGNFVKRSKEININDPIDPMDSTVHCDIDKDQLKDKATYQADVDVRDGVKLVPYTCDVTKASDHTIHIPDVLNGKDFTSYIKAGYDNSRAYKFLDQGTHGAFNGIGSSSLLYLDDYHNQKDITIDNVKGTLQPGRVYEYNGDAKFEYDKYAICNGTGVSIKNGVCEADIKGCAANTGPKTVGLYHYTSAKDYTPIKQTGVYVYKDNTVQRVPSGLSNLNNGTFSKVECTDLGAKLSSLTNTLYNNSCDIRKITIGGRTDTILSNVDPVVKNNIDECVIGSDYIVIGKSTWDPKVGSSTIIQPKDTFGGGEALSNNFTFSTYGILPNTNIKSGVSRTSLVNVTNLTAAEIECNKVETCTGIQHVISDNKYFMFQDLKSDNLESSGNSTVYVKRAECGTECLEYCADPGYERDNTSNVFFEIQGIKLGNGSNLGTSSLENAKNNCSGVDNCAGVQLINGMYHSGTYTVVDNVSSPISSVHYKHKACGAKVSRAIETLPIVILGLPSNLVNVPVVICWKIQNSEYKTYLIASESHIDKFGTRTKSDATKLHSTSAESYKIEEIGNETFELGSLSQYRVYNIKLVDLPGKVLLLDSEKNMIVSDSKMNASKFIFVTNSDDTLHMCCIDDKNKLLYFNTDNLNFINTRDNSKGFMIQERTNNLPEQTISIKDGKYSMRVYDSSTTFLVQINETTSFCTKMFMKYKIYTFNIDKDEKNKITVIFHNCNSTSFYRIFVVDNEGVVKGFLNYDSDNGIKTVDMLLRGITCTFILVPDTNTMKKTQDTSRFIFEDIKEYNFEFVNIYVEILNTGLTNRSLQFQNFNGFDFSEIIIYPLNEDRINIKGKMLQPCLVKSYGKFLMCSPGKPVEKIIMCDGSNDAGIEKRFLFSPIIDTTPNNKFNIIPVHDTTLVLSLNKDGYVYLRKSSILPNSDESTEFQILKIQNNDIKGIQDSLLGKRVSIRPYKSTSASITFTNIDKNDPHFTIYNIENKANNITEFRYNGKKFKQYLIGVDNNYLFFIPSADPDITKEHTDTTLLKDKTMEPSIIESEQREIRITFAKDVEEEKNIYYIFTPNGHFYHFNNKIKFKRKYNLTIYAHDENKFIIEEYKDSIAPVLPLPFLNETDTYRIVRKTGYYLYHMAQSYNGTPSFHAGRGESNLLKANVKLQKIDNDGWMIYFDKSTNPKRYIKFTSNTVNHVDGMTLSDGTNKENTKMTLIQPNNANGTNLYKITHKSNTGETFYLGQYTTSYLGFTVPALSWRKSQDGGNDEFIFGKVV